jgi:hypothetical protein
VGEGVRFACGANNPPYRDETAKGWATRFESGPSDLRPGFVVFGSVGRIATTTSLDDEDLLFRKV